MNFLSLIEAKREGKTLAPEQIKEFIREFTAGKVPDYQMAALLMASFFRGLNNAETTALTLAMRDSGDVLKFPKDKRPLVDKHSTGGIGDKVSLPLAPLLACLGFRVPMISGRGLGITGGTLDKLDSIPGFKTLLPAAQIITQVQKVGRRAQAGAGDGRAGQRMRHEHARDADGHEHAARPRRRQLAGSERKRCLPEPHRAADILSAASNDQPEGRWLHTD